MMDQTGALYSGPKDTTISLMLPENTFRVDIWVNKDIFTSRGALKKQQNFTDVDNTHLLSLKWPEQIKLTATTQWTPEIIAPSEERKREFAQRTAEDLGQNSWEMLRNVMKRCYEGLGACLLEVSFWGITLGHKDLEAAERAGSSKDTLHYLSFLLADVEYTFMDIHLKWNSPVLFCTTPPVPESSAPTLGNQELSISDTTTESPGPVLPHVSRRGSQEQEQEGTTGVLSTYEKKEQVIEEIRTSMVSLEQTVDNNHREVCEMLRELLHFHRAPGRLPQQLANSENPSEPPSPLHAPADQETTQRPQQDRNARVPALQPNHRGETRFHTSENASYPSRRNHSHPQNPRQGNAGSQTKHRNEQENAADSDNSGGNQHGASGNSSENPRRNPHQSQASRQREGIQNGATNVRLATGDNSNASREDDESSIKSNSSSSRKTNNWSSGSAEESRISSPSPRGTPNHLSQSSNTAAHRLPPSTFSSNLPSTPAPQATVPRQQSTVPRTPQTVTHSPERPASRFPSEARRTDSSAAEQQPSPLERSSHGRLGGVRRREGARQKESSETPRMQGSSSDGHRTKSETKAEELTMTLMVDSEEEAKLIKQSIREAYQQDEVKPPKAKSFDTMLCLDISASMERGGAFKQMKKTVLQFIEGVEEIVTQFGIEENMGLVTFGGRARVVQNLTNDFNLIRDHIDLLQPYGKSPFAEALLVSMAAFVKKGGIVSVSHEWLVRPRIIFISDGLPTESSRINDRDEPHNIQNIRLTLSNLLVNFKKSDKFTKVHPVFFIPVGDHANKKYMRALSEICDGVYTEPENIEQLYHYFRVQETIGKVIVCLRRESQGLEPEKVSATLEALSPGLEEDQRKEVLEAVQRELANPRRAQSQQPKPYDLEYVFEDTDKVDEGKRLPLGTRVIQGPDWTYADQDGGGPGTVINHHEWHSTHWVNWDNGDFNCYGFSENRGYHIWKTEEHPRLMKENEQLEIGMAVKKGKEWKPAEDLTEQGEGQGIIIRKSRSEGKVMVRWSNGVIQVCQWSPTGIQEVDYCPPETKADNPRSRPPQFRTETQEQRETVITTFEGEGRWQWCDENNTWHDYDEETNMLIEAACKKKNPRTCIIEREGERRRVMFRKMVEKLIDEGTECKVQRIQVGT